MFEANGADLRFGAYLQHVYENLLLQGGGREETKRFPPKNLPQLPDSQSLH